MEADKQIVTLLMNKFVPLPVTTPQFLCTCYGIHKPNNFCENNIYGAGK